MIDIQRVRKVVEDCERMLRFAPPPYHLAETNEWHDAIRNAQDLLKELPKVTSLSKKD